MGAGGKYHPLNEALGIMAIFFKMSTGICQYFCLTARLPSHKNIGIGAVATREANASRKANGMKCVLEKQGSQQSTKKLKRIPTSQS